MKCPECESKLEYYDNLAFHSLGDYIGEVLVHFIVGVLISILGLILTGFSEVLGYVVAFIGMSFFYYQLHTSRTIWVCKETNKKYVGKSLQPFKGY